MTQERINQKEFARMMYIYEGKEIIEISTIIGLAKSTVYKWFNDEDWKAEREGKTVSPSALADELKLSIFQIVTNARLEKRPLNGSEGDQISKLSKAREALMRDSNYMGIAFDVLDKFQKWLKDHNPKLLSVPLNNSVGEFLKFLLSSI